MEQKVADKTKEPKAKKAAPQSEPPSKPAKASLLSGFFSDDKIPEGQVIDEKNALHKYESATRLVRRQSYIIIALVLLVIVLIPAVHPVHKYMAVRTDKAKKGLVSLSAPNHTDRAVLSWMTSAVTEIMTFGFGDIESRLLSQRYRFTDDGWQSFIKAVFNNELLERFRSQQLVLTTAPLDAAVVTSKGYDEFGEYTWIVEMPVVMTYVTNNNLTSRSKSIVRLTIVRVPPHKSIDGIGIKKWYVM